MKKWLLILLALSLTALFVLRDDYGDRDTLVRETHAFTNSAARSPDNMIPEAYYAEAYDEADKLYPVVSHLCAILEKDLWNDIELSNADRRKARRLLEAWFERGLELRDPESMIHSTWISNADYAYGMLEMSRAEARQLCQEAFAILRDKPDKTPGQWIQLIECYLHGIGTRENIAKAKEAFGLATAELPAGSIEPYISSYKLSQWKQ